MAVRTKKDSVSRVLMRDAIWEPFLTRLVAKQIQEHANTTLLDIGGNLGWFSILGAALGARVTTFEPNAENRWLIGQSLCANKEWLPGSGPVAPAAWQSRDRRRRPAPKRQPGARVAR